MHRLTPSSIHIPSLGITAAPLHRDFISPDLYDPFLCLALYITQFPLSLLFLFNNFAPDILPLYTLALCILLIPYPCHHSLLLLLYSLTSTLSSLHHCTLLYYFFLPLPPVPHFNLCYRAAVVTVFSLKIVLFSSLVISLFSENRFINSSG